MIKTYSPIMELTKLQEEVNRLLCELSNHLSCGSLHDSSKWTPNVDLCEDSRRVVIKAELPGIPRDQVHVVMHENYLRISGEKPASLHHTKAHYHCLERSYGKFNRIIHLNRVVDSEGASARLENGVLTIILPKLTNRRRAEKPIPLE
jgi:HSP20 family protein